MNDLYLIEKGIPQNPPVICIHGLLGASRNLYRLVNAIAQADFHVIAYDQRGHGHSPHEDRYSLDSFASDAVNLMDFKRIDSAHFVGHSLGGRVALRVAARFPERVKTLSILDVSPKISEASLQELRSVIDPLPPSFDSKGQADEFLSRHTPKLKQFLLSNLRTSDHRQVWAFDLDGIRRSMWQELRTDQEQEWANLSCPALVLKGARSDHFSEAELSEMLKAKPDAKSAVIPDAGHWLHVDNFNDTAAAVTEFLRHSNR